MSTLKVSTISPLGTDATKTITIGSASNGDVAAGVFTNVPAFLADNGSTDQTISDQTTTKVDFGTTIYDTDNAFSSSKFTVPSNKGGKYFFFYSIDFLNTSDDTKVFDVRVYKNGSDITFHHTFNGNTNANLRRNTAFFSSVFNLLPDDYIELYFRGDSVGGSSFSIKSDNLTYFGGYRLIGA